MATSFAPDASTSRLLRDAFGRFATGVTVVTIATPSGPLGITANSFTSVSMEPPLILWAPGKSSSRYAAFVEAEHFSVHILAAEQSELCWAVAKDRFALHHLDLDLTDHGVPVIPGSLARFDCSRHAVHEAGDHALVIGLVEQASLRDGAPLAFYGSKAGSFVPQVAL